MSGNLTARVDSYAELWWTARDASTLSSSTFSMTSLMATFTNSITSTYLMSTSSMPILSGAGTVAGSSSASSVSRKANNVNSELTSLISSTFVTSIPTIITSPSTTLTTLVSTTITTSTGLAASGTSSPDLGSISATFQPVCIGDGLDISAVGLISTIVLPSVVGLVIWLLFAIIRPQFRQVYSVRTWFPPQDLRPRPLKDSWWSFLFPHVPLVVSLPDKSDISNGTNLPSDGQLGQMVLWTCFLVVSGWSLIGLAGALPLYLVYTPCLAQSVPRTSFGGLYSTLQDLSLLRLLQLLEDENFTTTNTVLSRAIVDGKDPSSNIRTRLIVLTMITIVLGMLPALYKLLKEFTSLVNYRQHWLEIQCGGMEMGWLSARDAPGFAGWGEKRIKDFLLKSGLSASLDRNGGIGLSGNMAGVGSGYRARTQNEQNRIQDEQALSNDEKAALHIDISSLFSIGDTGELSALIRERDRILEHLEIAEAQYIASFRLTTPDPSIAELPVARPPEDENNSKRISRPKALAGSQQVRSHQRHHKASLSSTAPTSYVAPSQYYKLRNVRGIGGGHILPQSGDKSSYGDGTSFSHSVRSRIVGSRFQEVNHDHAEGRLPIGRLVTLHQGELGPVTDAPVPANGPNHGIEPSSGNDETYPLPESVDPETSRGVSRIDDFPSTFLRYSTSRRPDISRDDSSPGTAPIASDTESGSYYLRHNAPHYPAERRETCPMRLKCNDEQNEAQVPLHLRLQPQGPFVRPLSGLDHDDLGTVYSDIGEWRTRFKQINNEISEAQNDCYNDIADGTRIKGWLITGRGVRFLPGIELIEGRSKDDILWSQLQHRSGFGEKTTFWSFVTMVTILLGAGLIAVAGLAVSTAPDVAHYLPFFQPLIDDKDKIGPGIATTLIPAVAATSFFVMAIGAIRHAAHYSGTICVSSAQLMTFKAMFFLLTVIGMMWFTAVGAVIFAMGAFASNSERPSAVASGSIYMGAFFFALVVNAAIIAPGLLLLQPMRLIHVLWRERRAITPRQRFRALYPSVYNPTYVNACSILAIIFASTFSFIFPLIGPAVVILLFLTIVAQRFLVGYVYGRTDAQTGGLLQIWLLKRFATVVTFQPVLLGLIFMTRRLFVEGGILVGCGIGVIVAVETYARWKTRLPGRKTLSTVAVNALEKFEEKSRPGSRIGSDSEGTSLASAPRMQQRGSMASVLEMMSLTLAVMPTPHQARGAVPLETESLDDLTATERAARTHPDAPPHLPALSFADHAEEMAGILYSPELIAPPPIIWLANDSAGIARSGAYDLQRYHNLRTTLDVRSQDDVLPRRSTSRQRTAS